MESKHSPKVRLILFLLITTSGLLLAADFFVHRHASFEHGDKNTLPLEMLPGFYAIYGFVACVVLVLVARIMRRVLMRPEDYYER